MSRRDDALAPDSPAARGWRGAAGVFAVAFGLRLAALAAIDPGELAVGSSAWDWGHEAASLALSIVEGRGYSDPWSHGTGASSWLTPPYPVLLALFLWTFGGVTYAMATALCVLQALASAATCSLLAPLGRTLGIEREGRLAAWLFAFYPLAISNSVQLVWDTTFVALALVAAYLAIARVSAAPRTSAVAGLAFGALAFLNPAPLAVAPIAAWSTWRRAGRGADGLRAVATFAACAFAVCAPWMTRNLGALGAFTLRPNFGVELKLGNRDGAIGHPQPTLFHPSHVEAELARYRELGEVEYSRECLRTALEWIREHPARFAGLTSKRVQFFWIGDPPPTDARHSAGRGAARDPASWIKFACYAALGLFGLAGAFVPRVARDVRMLLAGSALLFGAPYYVTHVSERYRFPIDPLLALLAAGALISVARKLRPKT